MKLATFATLLLLLPGLSLAQDRSPEGSPTPEEEFYEGDQVNAEAFEPGPAFEDMQEEEAPYDPYTEIWPYEESEQTLESDEGESFDN